MPTVIERLRELRKEAARAIPSGQTKKVLGPEATKGEVALEKYLHACHLALPAFLALADAVDRHKDVVRMGPKANHYMIVKTRQEVFAALADLEKEAT